MQLFGLNALNPTGLGFGLGGDFGAGSLTLPEDAQWNSTSGRSFSLSANRGSIDSVSFLSAEPSRPGTSTGPVTESSLASVRESNGGTSSFAPSQSDHPVTSDRGQAVMLYIQMQYCRHGTLQDWLKREDRTVERSQIRHIFRQLAAGLAHIHAQVGRSLRMLPFNHSIRASSTET